MLIMGSVNTPGSCCQAFFVVDGQVLCEIMNTFNIPLAILSAFYVFNICCPRGCYNFFFFSLQLSYWELIPKKFLHLFHISYLVLIWFNCDFYDFVIPSLGFLSCVKFCLSSNNYIALC